MRSSLQSPNKFNVYIKAKLIKVDNIFNLELEDKTVVYTYLSKGLYNYLRKNNIDLDQWYTWKGQYKTSQHPNDPDIDVLKVIQLVALEKNRQPDKYFSFIGFPFRIYNNQITKYNREYNFLLVNLFKHEDKESIKLCYKELEHPDLEYTKEGNPYVLSTKHNRKPIKFTCYQKGNNIVIKDIKLLY